MNWPDRCSFAWKGVQTGCVSPGGSTEVMSVKRGKGQAGEEPGLEQLSDDNTL